MGGQREADPGGIRGGGLLAEWDKPVWEHDLASGLRMLHLAIDTHLIAAHFALPLTGTASPWPAATALVHHLTRALTRGGGRYSATSARS